MYKINQEELSSVLEKTLERPQHRFNLHPDILDKYTKGKEMDGSIARLRLDFEFAEDVTDPKVLAPVMAKVMAEDLEDLIENGDAQQSDNALLKALDGARVRGKEVKVVKFVEPMTIVEPKPKKEMIEYTTFLLLYTEWE